MNNRKAFQRIVLIAVLLFFVAGTGCVPKRAVYVRMINKVELTPSTGGYVQVRAAVRVENHNPRSIYLTKASLNSWYNGGELGTITLQDEVEIRGRAVDTVWVPLDVRFTSAGRMLTFALQGGLEDWQNVEIEGFALLRYCGIRKKIRIQRRTLGELVQTW